MTTKAAVDPLIQKPYLMELARTYLGATPPRTPLRFATVRRLEGLPPRAGPGRLGQTLLDNSVHLCGALGSADVVVTLEAWPDMIHAFPLFHDQLAAGRRALARAGEFIRAWQSHG